jgi:hypothetical protein
LTQLNESKSLGLRPPRDNDRMSRPASAPIEARMVIGQDLTFSIQSKVVHTQSAMAGPVNPLMVVNRA